MSTPVFKTQPEIFEAMRTDAAQPDVLPEYDTAATGGVLRGILYIVSKALALLFQIMRDALRMAFSGTAEGAYLGDLAKSFGTDFKPTRKTRGYVRFFRAGTSGNVSIASGHLVGTDTTAEGVELNYSVVATTVLPDGESEVQVLVEAVQAGKRYNVAQGAIVALRQSVPGIDGVINDLSPTWLETVGTDRETDAELQARLALRWSALSTGATRDTYKAWASDILGVGEVAVDDTQPRGRGTIDVVILAVGGVLPPEPLIEQVQLYIDGKKPLTDDVLVKEPDLTDVSISVVVKKHPYLGELSAVQADVTAALQAMFAPDQNYPDVPLLGIGDDANRAQIYRVVMNRPNVVNVVIGAPSADVEIEFDEKARLDTLTVSVETVVET